jgi:hypothetical protein
MTNIFKETLVEPIKKIKDLKIPKGPHTPNIYAYGLMQQCTELDHYSLYAIVNNCKFSS